MPLNNNFNFMNDKYNFMNDKYNFVNDSNKKLNESTQICTNKIMDELNIDEDKLLNSKCFCNVGLPWIETDIVMVYPCEHMFHESCLNKDESSMIECKLCKTKIIKTFKLLDDDLHPQRFADILSVTHYTDMTADNNMSSFIDSIFSLTNPFIKALFAKDFNDGHKRCEEILSLNNLTMKVYGMEKLKLEHKKVLIGNHVAYLESIIIFYLFNTGFLASKTIMELPVINKIKDMMPNMLVERGNKDRKINIIDQMRNFIDEHNSLCVFPEGMYHHPDVLTRFRSGAFNIGYPVYAIVIRYLDVLADGYFQGLFYKFGGKSDLSIEVHVLGPYYPPFTDEDIENIRKDMAYHGRMILSRVSNRDVKDM